MEELIKFSKQLNDLIEQNSNLKDQLKRTEEWLKLAICVNGSLDFRTIENVDKETYDYFIKNTVISYSGSDGIKLIWSKPVPVDTYGWGLKPVSKEEIDRIFNGEKIENIIK